MQTSLKTSAYVANSFTARNQVGTSSFTKRSQAFCPKTRQLTFQEPKKNLNRQLHSSTIVSMIEIAPGVKFDTIAREWRFKWSPDNDKESLVEAQKLLEEYLPTIKAVDGVKDVQRVVCGGCLDFKVTIALNADKFGGWESKDFAPEAQFLEKAKNIAGVSSIETQTFTLMPM